jgi:hypothetical protein
MQARLPTHLEYEEKLAHYNKLAQDMWEAAVDVDLEFLRINARPLGTALREEAQAWASGLCQAMRSTDLQAQQVRPRAVN